MPAPRFVDTVHRVETPENVALAFRTAGLWSRGLAFLLDWLIIIGVLFLIFFLIVKVLLETSWGVQKVETGGLVWLGPFIAFTMQAGYFLFFETISAGRTPGKRIFRLRVVKVEGQPIGFYDAMLRNLVRVIDALPMAFLSTGQALSGFGPSTYAVALVAMVFSSRSQRLGDMAAGTFVVYEANPAYRRQLGAIREVEPFTSKEISRSFRPSERTLAKIEAFLERRPRLRKSRANELARILAMPIAEKIGFISSELDPEASPVSFLLRVVRTYSEDPATSKSVAASVAEYSAERRSAAPLGANARDAR